MPEEVNMNNIDEVLLDVSIGSTIAALFLFNTSRIPKAIELWKECLAVFSNKLVGKQNIHIKSLYELIHWHIIEAYRRISDYQSAIKYCEELIALHRESGNRAEEGKVLIKMATLYDSQCKCGEAIEIYEEAMTLSNEIGDRRIEAESYSGLGIIYKIQGDYLKAEGYLKKALSIDMEIGNRQGEATNYGNLGTVFRCLGKYSKAKEYHENALEINMEIGNRQGMARDYGNLGTVFECLGEYVKAKECLENALAIGRETGGRDGEALIFARLGTVFKSLLEYVKAKECFNKALKISAKTGDKYAEAASHEGLGVAFHALKDYEMARKHYENALVIQQEIGNRAGEATSYGNLGSIFHYLGEHCRAKEYHEKALATRKEIGDREGEAIAYGNLGAVFQYLGECASAEKSYMNALKITEEIESVPLQVPLLCRLAGLKFMEGNVQEACSYLVPSIQKCEEMRGSFGKDDQFKIFLSDKHHFPYWALSDVFCSIGNPNDALCVSELGRARALADLIATQYSLENNISTNPQSWLGIERVIKNERNSTCLYIAYSAGKLFLWVIENSGVIHFRKTKVNENINHNGDLSNVDDFFAKELRTFSTLNEKNCEDRSLNEVQPTRESSPVDSLPGVPAAGKNKQSQEGEPILALCYKLIIAPVVEFIKEPEIIIVPDGSLYKVPFSALSDDSGKFLSERFWIRIVPSLSTLKLIQDSPADYHIQTGALIVGNPDVGRVRYQGRPKRILRLPCAGREAEMIGRLLGVPPLLGEQATKEAVLERLNSVSLIHFAAHGDSDTGEIALAPKRPTARNLPKEEEYLLKMSDISKFRLRAKLVVLSCCHSGRGQIRAEGVVGIARAFLGSGARSVLVALWALEDIATEQFMHRFYEHLVRGESASECLHEAMKWMRGNGYSEVAQWAPFMLMGDNVAFDFKKEMEAELALHNTSTKVAS